MDLYSCFLMKRFFSHISEIYSFYCGTKEVLFNFLIDHVIFLLLSQANTYLVFGL